MSRLSYSNVRTLAKGEPWRRGRRRREVWRA